MRVISLLSVALIFVSCSHRAEKSVSNHSFIPGVTPIEPLQSLGAENTQAQPQGHHGDLNDNETDMQNLPSELNERVTQWLEYFQGRGRPHMERYLSRSSRYLPKMKEIMNKHGLPEDLVYIALIESGFNSKALSRARAVGYWQFIGGTGRRYGLTQNYYVDERRDFIDSTEAAAKYLKALYNLFGSWYLAIASYNVGENRVKNLVMKYYTRNFWELAQKGRLPHETTNYVPKFLAARLIAKHPEKYGFDNVVYEPPLDFKEVALEKGIHLDKFAKHIGVSLPVLKGLNPAYKRGVIPKREGGAIVRVPTSIEDKDILVALQKSYSNAEMHVIAAGAGHNYRIQRGDTLSHIAQKFGTSIAALREANDLGRRSTLYPGKKLIIPTGRRVASSSKTKIVTKAGERTYKVRRGDNLYTIAKRFGVSIAQIKKRNKLGRKSLLSIGKVLVIPSRT
ncbi:MAG: LysM peptidoglycan-binding domain-containing protein [Bdellovibrionales bacterium]|nr:LysM peptidoglycan-binding domain-containing protein [Bdellovibrionales bacterium]